MTAPVAAGPTLVGVPVLVATALSVGYGGEPVCAPVTAEVDAGQALALVGENGSGKSTVLRAMLGLLSPADGRVEVLGREVDEREAGFRAAVAAVLDDDAYFPALTVAEHLRLTARGHGVVDAVVEEVLAELGLADHADSLPAALSSGQRRRLLLAGAFVRPRRLLVLDEPEQRLDTRMREHLARRLNDEKRAGGAVVLATHDPDLLAAVADRCVHLADDASPVVGVPEALAVIGRSPR